MGGGLPGPDLAAGGAAPGPATTTTAAIPDRPPKTFPAWNQQVNTYEERRLDGKRRVFDGPKGTKSLRCRRSTA